VSSDLLLPSPPVFSRPGGESTGSSEEKRSGEARSLQAFVPAGLKVV